MKWFFFIKVAREFLLDTETDISSAVWGAGGPGFVYFSDINCFLISVRFRTFHQNRKTRNKPINYVKE